MTSAWPRPRRRGGSYGVPGYSDFSGFSSCFARELLHSRANCGGFGENRVLIFKNRVRVGAAAPKIGPF